MDEATLSQILREQFRMLGEQIGLAGNIPEALKPLLKGENATATLKLHKGRNLYLLYCSELPTLRQIIEDQQGAIKILANKNKELHKKIAHLNTELVKEQEHNKPPDSEWKSDPEITMTIGKSIKPKKKIIEKTSTYSRIKKEDSGIVLKKRNPTK